MNQLPSARIYILFVTIKFEQNYRLKNETFVVDFAKYV